ncbi:MAG: NAD(P)/FAD-dependent oxidoreductase [bacterium]|nr:NAD(P)/FAD-dependent oxidoreductase [bacterium]
MLGMTLARRLAHADQEVAIWEGAPALGGLASAWSLGDVVWDRHYHVTLASDQALRGLLRELDLEQEIAWVTTRTGFFAGGRLYSLSSIVEYLTFPLLSPLEKARLAATILHASRLRDWRKLERITAVEWLTRLSGRGTVEKVWYPLLRSKLGANADTVSAAFIWAIIARMYGARRSSGKSEQFGYVSGGYARVLDRFAAALAADGVRIETDRRVASVEQSQESELTVTSAEGVTERFDRVVVTAAAPVAARMCPQLSANERSLLEGVEYQGIICASLLLDRPLSPYYITNITEGWVPFTAVIEMSALVDRSTFGGRSLVYLPKYLTPSDPAFARSDEDIEREFLDALARMYPHFDRSLVRSFRISRVRYVLPLSTLGYSDRLPPMHTSVPGLHIVNGAHILNGTLNVNETVQLAERAYLELLADPVAAPLKIANLR